MPGPPVASGPGMGPWSQSPHNSSSVGEWQSDDDQPQVAAAKERWQTSTAERTLTPQGLQSGLGLISQPLLSLEKPEARTVATWDPGWMGCEAGWSPLREDPISLPLSPGERSEVSQATPGRDLEAQRQLAGRVGATEMEGCRTDDSRPDPATPTSVGASSVSGRQEIRLGLSPTVFDLRPEMKVAGRSRVGRCAGPSLSQSLERIFLPIETQLRDQPAAIRTTSSGRVSHPRLMLNGDGVGYSEREPGWEPQGLNLPPEPSPSHMRCLPRNDADLEEFQWSAGLIIGDSTLGSHAGSGLFHSEGIPLPQGAIAYLGQYGGIPIRRDMVAQGSGNLDYVFLEEDEDMGVDGRETFLCELGKPHVQSVEGQC